MSNTVFSCKIHVIIQKITNFLLKHMSNKIDPKKSWMILQENKTSYVIDVRPEPEAIYGGKPDLSELKKETINIPYTLYPSMRENPNFVREFNKFIFNDNSVTFLICKDGTLSERAAEKLKQAGKKNECYTIENGFEGQMSDMEKKRSMINGWKASGLPYEDD